jgi:hypothetical protein
MQKGVPGAAEQASASKTLLLPHVASALEDADGVRFIWASWVPHLKAEGPLPRYLLSEHPLLDDAQDACVERDLRCKKFLSYKSQYITAKKKIKIIIIY